MLWTLLACTTAEPALVESEGRPALGQRVEVDGGWLDLTGGAAVLHYEGTVLPLSTELLEPPAVSEDGRRVALVRRDAGLVSAIELLENGQVRRLTDEGAPDRVALSPEGQHIAWVASPQGLPSVFVAPWDGEPVQLTNVDLPPGSPPPGFVDPPRSAPAFDGRFVVWSGESDQRVAF